MTNYMDVWRRGDGVYIIETTNGVRVYMNRREAEELKRKLFGMLSLRY